MSDAQRPWLKSYDQGIPAEVEIPALTLIERIEEMARTHADETALHFLGTRLTYAELMRQARCFAQALLALGCQRGDVVGFNLPNIPQCLVTLLGTLLAGCAASGFSPLLTSRELAYQVNDSGARVLVTLDAIFERRLAPVAGELKTLETLVTTGLADTLPWHMRFLGRLLKKIPHGRVRPLPSIEVRSFAELLASHPDTAPGVRLTPEDACFIQYTGGTTGVPKGSLLTHRNMVANLVQIEHWCRPDLGREVLCSGFPIFHQAGLALSMAALWLGCSQILVPNPRDAKHIVKEIARHRPTILVNVPSLYMKLASEPSFHRLDFSSLSFALSGAAPFPVEEMRKLEQVIGAGKAVEVYGMTETSPLITMNPRFGKKKLGSVGLPLPSTRVRLVDLATRTRDVAPGEEGELIVAGPQVMKEYWRKPEETAIVLRDHEGEVWLHTGDVAVMDAEGYFTIVDRAKDMLNVGGFKVFSREVEEKLHEHPAIGRCAIVGVPNPETPGSELVKLVVELAAEARRRDAAEVKQEITAFARQNLSPYKVPKIIEFRDELPLTLVGKVDKKALR